MVADVHTRTIVTPTGVRLSCYLSGNPAAPAMLLLHALGETAATWNGVVPRVGADYRVVTLDLRGHGASDWPGEYSFELMRDDVLAVLDELELDDLVLVGHSMGGAVAYLLAQAQPSRFAGLVVEDAPPPYPRTRALPERPDTLLPFDWAVVPAIAEEVDDPTLRWWRDLPLVSAPTLLIGGGPMSHIPQERLAEVVRLIPDCTLITIPVGHQVHESRPEEFTRAVLSWLGDPRLLPMPHPPQRRQPG